MDILMFSEIYSKISMFEHQIFKIFLGWGRGEHAPRPPRKLVLHTSQSVLRTLCSTSLTCVPPPLSKILDPPLIAL